MELSLLFLAEFGWSRPSYQPRVRELLIALTGESVRQIRRAAGVLIISGQCRRGRACGEEATWGRRRISRKRSGSKVRGERGEGRGGSAVDDDGDAVLGPELTSCAHAMSRGREWKGRGMRGGRSESREGQNRLGALCGYICPFAPISSSTTGLACLLRVGVRNVQIIFSLQARDIRLGRRAHPPFRAWLRAAGRASLPRGSPSAPHHRHLVLHHRSRLPHHHGLDDLSAQPVRTPSARRAKW